MIGKIIDAFRSLMPARLPWRRQAPIDDVDALFEFARTRAAFVTQKKLYGYLKTRMGLKFPQMFEQDDFAQSIRLATRHIMAASLADLTLFCVARTMDHARFNAEDKAKLAIACYQSGLAESDDGIVDKVEVETWQQAFNARAAGTNWTIEDKEFFRESPKALIKWAPIADELKRYDVEIVEGSMRHAWIEIRRDFLTLIDRDKMVAAIADDLAM